MKSLKNKARCQIFFAQKNQGMYTCVYACVTHDDLVTNKGDCCVHKGCRCCCTRECALVRFCEVTWSGEWLVNFNHPLPVWLSWSSMEHRARCFSLPAHSLKIKLDRKRSQKAGEFAAACVSHLRVRLSRIIRQNIMHHLHQLLVDSGWPNATIKT